MWSDKLNTMAIGIRSASDAQPAAANMDGVHMVYENNMRQGLEKLKALVKKYNYIAVARSPRWDSDIQSSIIHFKRLQDCCWPGNAARCIGDFLSGNEYLYQAMITNQGCYKNKKIKK